MVKRCRAVFMDDDIPRDEPREDFPLKPSLVVNSSPGKYHYYWLTDTEDKDTWQKVQNGIIAKYDGDNNAKDLTRYLRLPGYNHNKSKEFMVPWEGSGHVYKWDEITAAFPPSEKEIKQGNIASLNTNSQSEVEIENIIMTGSDGLHGAINKYLLGEKNDGVHRAKAFRRVKQLADYCSDEVKGTERWQSYTSDYELERSWDGAEEINIVLPDFPKDEAEVDNDDMPWPPGLLGELSKSALAMANHPRKEIAIVSALGVVAGICGRKFNIHGAGLNVYITLVAKTGTGKDAIPNFIQRLFSEVNDIGTAMSFLGSGRFTGPKSIIDSMESARSQINVMSELGLLLQSKAGDSTGLTRMLLNIYGKSGKHLATMPEPYSNKDNSIPSLLSPAMSIVAESTPETLIDILHDTDAFNNGSVPRQSIFRIFGDKPDTNFYAHKVSFPDNVIQRLKSLIQPCAACQVTDDYKVWDIEFGDQDERVKNLAIRYNKIHNDLQHTDPIKSAMYGRAWVKLLKYAGLVTAINTTELVLTKEAVNWAEAMIDYEMSGLELFFRGSSGNALDDLAKGPVAKAIDKVIKGKYGKSIPQSDAKQRKQGIFPLSGARAALKNNNDLARISSDVKRSAKPVDGYMKVIEYMISVGLLVDVSTPKKKLLQITEDFRSIVYGK
ncbi:MAG: hypothetical protein DRI65_14215 [Chloroflexota bacterium]|nr:MAG: hypothetical protein DRI65_14215 [Chloroflexota bacterium]